MRIIRKGVGVLLKTGILLAAALPQISSNAATPPTEQFGPSNPFYAPSPLPLQAPPFDKIKDSDYQPALEAGMAQQRDELRAIAENPQPPTFENTLVALEKSGQLFQRVALVFNGVAGANLSPELEKLQEIEAPKFAAQRDAMFLDSKLFHRVETIYKDRASLKLDPESMRLVEYYYQQFVHAGANLSDADKAELKKLNEEESTLSAAFSKKLLAATKAAAYVTSDKGALAGFSETRMEGAAESAKERKLGGYVIPLQNTTQQPDLASLSVRKTRQAIFEDSWTRAERGDGNDTRGIVARMAEVRAQKAKLLGFSNFAAWKLQDQMAKTPLAAVKFMDELVPGSTAKALAEGKDIQSLIDSQKGGFTLQPWDWDFYAQQVRKAKYDLDEEQIKPYFELNSVLQNGVFYAANQLYGITFKERHDIPVYQPDVRVFDVFDSDGKQLALWYCDYFKRDNKNGGAWMDVFVNQSKLLGTLPVVYNVANFTKPAAGQPALLSFRDVTTMFHEFGHALHGMFANTVYPTLSGSQVARDFVEFPSQFNENWASYPAVFSHYAKHYQTGEPMPSDLVGKIKKASKFNQGYALTEVVAAAELDMQWHMLPGDSPIQNVDDFEVQALKKKNLYLSAVPTRYRTSYFAHIWQDDYAAGYYAYLWTEMLDHAAYHWFEENGGMTRANGDRFRQMILSRGNTEDLGKMYSNWLGGEPSIEPMLKFRGLVPEEPGK
ncbi:MAG TPA: peptidyl-dipeptidase Dcp [Candidatus Sulfotelmatobacter sp.]|nr:peptidyl-dipeptidase Dcp [Candidatus Sulfotelmatobacter sp.]